MPIKRLNLSFIWVGLASALLACSGISTIWLTMQQRSAQGWVTHTFQVEQTLSALQIIEMRAEIERRGYIVTGDSAAATRYLSALHQVPVSVDRLQTFVADNPRQIAKFPALRNAIAQWMSSRQRSVQLVRSGDVQAAATLLGSPVTRATTAKMLGIITSMRDEEERLLAERQYRSSQLQSMVRATPAISLLFLIFLMAFVLNDRRRQMRALQLSHAQLAADIAARKGVESQLALLAANATDAVHRLTLDGVCLYVSPSVESVLGLTPETLIGKSILTGIHPDDIEDVKSHLAQFSRGEMSRAVVTYRVGAPETPDGWIWLEAHAGLVTTTDDSLPAEIIVSVRDITARKTLEIELAAARVRAESAVRAKATFLANMSHEIRTPMNGVIGFTELVLASKLDADQRRQVELIADSGRSMMRLLNDILDLSKVEAGHLKLNAEAISLRHVLNSCVSLMQGSALAKSIALDCQVEPTVPIWLMADGLRIRQVVLNLLGNALKFTDNGHVIVRAGHDATIVDGYWIEVEDSGHGIAPARQMAIFEEFVQASDTTARDHGGTGLGLAISSGLVRLMGGTLTLDSELGRGSRFRFTLQAARCEAPSQTRAPDRGGIAERRRFHRPDRSERCCQSNANRSPLDAGRSLRWRIYPMTDCHSASAAERRSL